MKTRKEITELKKQIERLEERVWSVEHPYKYNVGSKLWVGNHNYNGELYELEECLIVGQKIESGFRDYLKYYTIFVDGGLKDRSESQLYNEEEKEKVIKENKDIIIIK